MVTEYGISWKHHDTVDTIRSSFVETATAWMVRVKGVAAPDVCFCVYTFEDESQRELHPPPEQAVSELSVGSNWQEVPHDVVIVLRKLFHAVLDTFVPPARYAARYSLSRIARTYSMPSCAR